MLIYYYIFMALVTLIFKIKFLWGSHFSFVVVEFGCSRKKENLLEKRLNLLQQSWQNSYGAVIFSLFDFWFTSA